MAKDEGISKGGMFGIAGGVLGFILLVGGGMVGCPAYKVYSERMNGQARLANAMSSEQVAVAEAEAKEVAATHLANADIARAKGVAQANQIIGQSLEKNEKYLTWLWIEALKEGKNDVIYVPTEANIPILEASRGLSHAVKKDTTSKQ